MQKLKEIVCKAKEKEVFFVASIDLQVTEETNQMLNFLRRS